MDIQSITPPFPHKSSMSEPDGEMTHPARGVQSLKATDLTLNSLDRKHIHPIPCNHSFLSHFKGTELQIFFPEAKNLIHRYFLYGSLGFKNFEWVAHR